MSLHWWLISDIDGTLTGDERALARLRSRLEADRERIGFGVASGRSPELIREAVASYSLPQPELFIASVGSEISHPQIDPEAWPGEKAGGWQPDLIRELLAGVPGVELQSEAGQGRYKLGYLADAASAAAAARRLQAAGLEAQLVPSAGEFLDIMPKGVSKGSAVRFAAHALQVPLHQVIVAGDTGNDLDMLTCGARAILVANHTKEVAHLKQDPGVYVARNPHAAGIMEGLRHYGVFEEA